MEEPNELNVEVGNLIEFINHTKPNQSGIGYVEHTTAEYFTVKWINEMKSEARTVFWIAELAAGDPKLFSFRVVNNNQRLYFPLEI